MLYTSITVLRQCSMLLLSALRNCALRWCAFCIASAVIFITISTDRPGVVFAAVQEGVINDLVLLSIVGIQPVLVHGGGPEINIWLNKLGIEAEFKNGLRVTDGELGEKGRLQGHYRRATT